MQALHHSLFIPTDELHYDVIVIRVICRWTLFPVRTTSYMILFKFIIKRLIIDLTFKLKKKLFPTIELGNISKDSDILHECIV